MSPANGLAHRLCASILGVQSSPSSYRCHFCHFGGLHGGSDLEGWNTLYHQGDEKCGVVTCSICSLVAFGKQWSHRGLQSGREREHFARQSSYTAKPMQAKVATFGMQYFFTALRGILKGQSTALGRVCITRTQLWCKADECTKTSSYTFHEGVISCVQYSEPL